MSISEPGFTGLKQRNPRSFECENPGKQGKFIPPQTPLKTLVLLVPVIPRVWTSAQVKKLVWGMKRVEPGYLYFNKTRLSEHFILGAKLYARFPMQACGSIFVSHECQVSPGFHGNKSSKQPGVHAHVRVRYTETSGV